MVALVAVVAGSLVGVGVAYAQEPDPPGGFGPGANGRGAGLGLLQVDSEALHQAIADALGISLGEFESARAEGITLAQLAAQHGVEIEELRAIMQAFHAEAVSEAVDQGTITQEQADWLLERRSGFGSGPGLGECDGDGPFGEGAFGPGLGGRAGRRAAAP